MMWGLLHRNAPWLKHIWGCTQSYIPSSSLFLENTLASCKNSCSNHFLSLPSTAASAKSTLSSFSDWAASQLLTSAPVRGLETLLDWILSPSSDFSLDTLPGQFINCSSPKHPLRSSLKQNSAKQQSWLDIGSFKHSYRFTEAVCYPYGYYCMMTCLHNNFILSHPGSCSSFSPCRYGRGTSKTPSMVHSYWKKDIIKKWYQSHINQFIQGLSIAEEILFKCNRVVIPLGLTAEMLKCIHEWYLGIEKCKNIKQKRFWFCHKLIQT